MRVELEHLRTRYATAATPVQAGRAVLEAIERLKSQPRLTLEQASVLLYMAVDHAAESGRLDPDIEDGIRELFLTKSMTERVVRAFREQWIAPYLANLDGEKLDLAWQQTAAGGQSDRLRMQKMFALAMSAGELNAAERQRLLGLVEREDLDPAARQQLSAELLGAFVATLDTAGASPELTEGLVRDIGRMVGAHPEDPQLVAAAQDLFFRGRGEDGALARLADVFADLPDLTAGEWNAVLRLVSGPDGRLDETGMLKLLLRMAADDRVSDVEATVLELLAARPKSERAARLLADWQNARNPDRARTDALGAVSRVGASLLGGDVGRLEVAINAARDGIAIEQSGVVLSALDHLAAAGLFARPVPEQVARAVVEILCRALSDPPGSTSSNGTGQLLVEILTAIVGDRMSVIEALENAGALSLVNDGGEAPGQAQRYLFSEHHAYALTIQEDLTFTLMDIDLETGSRRQVKLPIGMSVDMPTMVRVGDEILIFGVDDEQNKCVVSYDTRTGTPGVAQPIELTAGSIVAHPDGALLIGELIRGGPPATAVRVDSSGQVELVENKVHSLPVSIDSETPLRDVWVELNIEHAYPPDLKLHLVAPEPAGTRIALKPTEDAKGYHGWYRVDPEALATVELASVAGTWTLEIEDTLSGDAGRLDGWSIAFGQAAGPQAMASQQSVHLRTRDGKWKMVAPLRTPIRSAVSVVSEDELILVGSAGLTEEAGSARGPALAETAPVVRYDPSTGERGTLPAIELPGFSPEGAWIEDGALWVSGSTIEVGGKNPRRWHLLSLSLSDPDARWRRIDTGKNVLVATPEGLAGVVAGRIGSGASANVAAIVPVEGREVGSKGVTQRKIELVQSLLAGVRAAGALASAEARGLLDMLDDLRRDDALTDGLRATVERVVGSVQLEVGALLALTQRWYGAGRSLVDEAEVQGLLAGLRRNLRTSEDVLVDIARISASETGVYELFKLDWRSLPAPLSGDAVRLLTETLSLALDRLLTRSAVTSVEVGRFAEAATRLRRLGDARAVDEMVRRLLFGARHTDDSADALRGYLSQGVRFSPLEARLGLSHFEKNDGQIRLSELRGVAAMTDADGVRDVTDRAMIDRVASAYLSKGARSKLSVLARSVTYAADLVGDDPAARGGKVDGTGNLVVWAKENETASKGQVYRVGLDQKIETRSDGVHTPRVHVSGRTILETVAGHQPFSDGEMVTTDAFDQVQALWTANEVLTRLEAAGIDVDSLQRDELNGGKLRLRVNATHEVNAWYDPETNEITFGTSDDKWHLGSDSDVVAHEIGHYVLDHINRDMETWGDAGAIHEGFGDILAALLFNEPEVSEDFGRFEGGEPNGTEGREGVFLRSVDNDLTLDQVTEEIHDRGRVFSGFLWSIKRALAEIVGDDARAATLMFAAVVKHPFFYVTTRVSREDFLDAIVRALRREVEPVLDASQLEELLSRIADEARARKLVGPSTPKPTPDESGGKVPVGSGETTGEGQGAHDTVESGGPAAPVSGALLGRLRQPGTTHALRRRNPRPTELVRVLNESDAVRRPAGVSFVPVQQLHADGMSKMIFQGVASNPETGEQLLVEDGYVGIVADRGEIVQAAGGGTRLEGAVDWSPIAEDPRMAEKTALRLVREFTTSQLGHNEAIRAVLSSLGDEVFSPRHSRCEEVIYNGRRSLKVTNACGVFLVDVRAGKVKAKRVLRD